MNRITLVHRRFVELRALARPLLVVLLVSSAAGAIATTASAEARPSHRGGRLVAETYMTPEAGGHLASRRGVAITVPAGVMKRSGEVTITSFGRGVYDVHIRAPWHGSVQVTVPLRGKRDRVLHDIGGTWVAESAQRGVATLTVTQLSKFSDFVGAVKDAIQGKLCIYTSLVKLIECAGDHLDSQLTAYVESKLPHDCVIQLLEGGDPLGVAEAALSGDCTGQAGEVGYHVPTTPSSTPPSTSTPSPSTSTPPATGSQPPPTSAEPEPEPAPSPPPPPPPPPGRSIEIGWSGAHAGWIWMTFNGFSTGSHEYTCVFNNGTDTYKLGETESPETWDNAATCNDEEPGGTVRVEVEGVSSNTLTVP
jgi:hypothetical protein